MQSHRMMEEVKENSNRDQSTAYGVLRVRRIRMRHWSHWVGDRSRSRRQGNLKQQNRRSRNRKQANHKQLRVRDHSDPLRLCRKRSRASSLRSLRQAVKNEFYRWRDPRARHQRNLKWKLLSEANSQLQEVTREAKSNYQPREANKGGNPLIRHKRSHSNSNKKLFQDKVKQPLRDPRSQGKAASPRRSFNWRAPNND